MTLGDTKNYLALLTLAAAPVIARGTTAAASKPDVASSGLTIRDITDSAGRTPAEENGKGKKDETEQSKERVANLAGVVEFAPFLEPVAVGFGYWWRSAFRFACSGPHRHPRFAHITRLGPVLGRAGEAGPPQTQCTHDRVGCYCRHLVSRLAWSCETSNGASYAEGDDRMWS
ncbi:MAG: hypothetical protein JSU63_06815 [Phycisphaerales bacterium]|nr:MAG: hypothetical protein JSU63_06815 [Phycisphaerales bacterium]